MASLRRKDRSPFWFACFTLPDGTRTQRSTGTHQRRIAQRIASEFEESARQASGGRFVESRARKTIADIYAMANTDTLPTSTTADFFKSWLKRKQIEADDSTHERYAGTVTQFIEHLGSRSQRDITHISAVDISSFRDAVARRLAPGSVNLMLKILRVAFTAARRDGLIDTNPAEKVPILKKSREAARRAFTLSELQSILKVADDEWRGMILFGVYTGQRLGDIAGLMWQNVDLKRGEVSLVTGKTGRQQILPLAAPLRRWIDSLPAAQKPDAPLFQNAFDIIQRQGRAGTLSNQFYGILVSAGLAPKKSHKATKNGRDAKREQNQLSFHSLRHTATTLLKSAGVSESITMEFVGHDSASVSRNYTHIDTATLKLAAAKLPDITKQ